MRFSWCYLDLFGTDDSYDDWHQCYTLLILHHPWVACMIQWLFALYQISTCMIACMIYWCSFVIVWCFPLCSSSSTFMDDSSIPAMSNNDRLDVYVASESCFCSSSLLDFRVLRISCGPRGKQSRLQTTAPYHHGTGERNFQGPQDGDHTEAYAKTGPRTSCLFETCNIMSRCNASCKSCTIAFNYSQVNRKQHVGFLGSYCKIAWCAGLTD